MAAGTHGGHNFRKRVFREVSKNVVVQKSQKMLNTSFALVCTGITVLSVSASVAYGLYAQDNLENREALGKDVGFALAKSVENIEHPNIEQALRLSEDDFRSMIATYPNANIFADGIQNINVEGWNTPYGMVARAESLVSFCYFEPEGNRKLFHAFLDSKDATVERPAWIVSSLSEKKGAWCG